MSDRLVGCQPGFAVSLPGQHTARTRNISNRIIREAQSIRGCPENEKHANDNEKDQA